MSDYYHILRAEYKMIQYMDNAEQEIFDACGENKSLLVYAIIIGSSNEISLDNDIASRTLSSYETIDESLYVLADCICKALRNNNALKVGKMLYSSLYNCFFITIEKNHPPENKETIYYKFVISDSKSVGWTCYLLACGNDLKNEARYLDSKEGTLHRKIRFPLPKETHRLKGLFRFATPSERVSQSNNETIESISYSDADWPRDIRIALTKVGIKGECWNFTETDNIGGEGAIALVQDAIINWAIRDVKSNEFANFVSESEPIPVVSWIRSPIKLTKLNMFAIGHVFQARYKIQNEAASVSSLVLTAPSVELDAMHTKVAWGIDNGSSSEDVDDDDTILKGVIDKFNNKPEIQNIFKIGSITDEDILKAIDKSHLRKIKEENPDVYHLWREAQIALVSYEKLLTASTNMVESFLSNLSIDKHLVDDEWNKFKDDTNDYLTYSFALIKYEVDSMRMYNNEIDDKNSMHMISVMKGFENSATSSYINAHTLLRKAGRSEFESVGAEKITTAYVALLQACKMRMVTEATKEDDIIKKASLPGVRIQRGNEMLLQDEILEKLKSISGIDGLGIKIEISLTGTVSVELTNITSAALQLYLMVLVRKILNNKRYGNIEGLPLSENGLRRSQILSGAYLIDNAEDVLMYDATRKHLYVIHRRKGIELTTAVITDVLDNVKSHQIIPSENTVVIKIKYGKYYEVLFRQHTNMTMGMIGTIMRRRFNTATTSRDYMDADSWTRALFGNEGLHKVSEHVSKMFLSMGVHGLCWKNMKLDNQSIGNQMFRPMEEKIGLACTMTLNCGATSPTVVVLNKNLAPGKYINHNVGHVELSEQYNLRLAGENDIFYMVYNINAFIDRRSVMWGI